MPSVKDIMTKQVILIDANKSIFQAAELMATNSVGCLVIAKNDVPIGIITERDIVRRFVAKVFRASDLMVSEIMSNPLVTVKHDASLKEAARLMAKNKVRRLPVVNDGKLVGIIVASDFVRNVSKQSITDEILNALGRHSSS